MTETIFINDNDKLSTELFFEKASLFFNLRKFNILHIGAHLGEEVKIYRKYTNNNIYLVEGNPKIFLKLKKLFHNKKKIHLINQVISNKVEKRSFFLHKFGNSFKSSSLLNIDYLSKIVTTFKGTETLQVKTNSINNVMRNIDLLVLDIQGTEYEVLKVLKKKYFSKLKIIIVEENKTYNYKNQSNALQIKNFLKHNNFIKVLKIAHFLHNKNKFFEGWSNNMYINLNLKNKELCLTKYYKFYKSQF